jgi:hypothetical protein
VVRLALRFVYRFPGHLALEVTRPARKPIPAEIRQKEVKWCLKGLGIDPVLTAPLPPWQNPFVERLIGNLRRDGLDHVILLGQAHLRRLLQS